MYDTGYYATGYYATDYYMRGAAVPVTDEKRGPFIDRFKEYHEQAMREDEEFIILLRAIVKVIDPWG